MAIQDLENYFTSGARSAGHRFYADGKVSITMHSDTQLTAYVKPNFKVTLKSPTVESPQVFAACSCPDFKKERLCKHAWAAVLGAEDKSPDFLDNKSEIEINTDAEGVAKPSFTPKPQSQAQKEAQAAYKTKQNEYRKEQYKKQKQRLKEVKNAKKKAPAAESTFPKGIEKALSYFLENGFDFKVSFEAESIVRARKKLSRVFHPDIGGTHQEIIELNKHADVLLKYLVAKNKIS